MRRRTTLLLTLTYLACGAAVGTTTSHAATVWQCQGQDRSYSRAEIRSCVIPRVFGEAAPAARRVAACESDFNPHAWNASSGARGVFQFLGSTWASTPYADRRWSHPVFNAKAAHWLSGGGTNWSQWACRP